MKTILILLLLAGAAGVARADAFAFKDLPGYEKCMTLDHLVETVTTDKGQQTRFLTESEIQERCIESAVKLLAGQKPDLMLEFVKATRRLSSPIAALDLVRVLADASRPACNDTTVYEAILAGLEQPADEPVYLPKARAIVKRCLADAAFKRDFLDEQDNAARSIRTNACQILVEEKLVKSCRSHK